MRDRDEINKIEYYMDLIQGLDSDLLSLLQERLDLSEQFHDYLLKNNLENSGVYLDRSSQDVSPSGSKEVDFILSEIDKIERANFNKLSRKYLVKYAYISEVPDHMLELVFRKIVGKKISRFDLDKDQIKNLLARQNFKGYFLNGQSMFDAIDHLDDVTDQVKEIGSVNLIQKYRGRNFGFNTEFIGLIKLLNKENINLEGKQILILENNNKSNFLDFGLSNFNVASIDHLSLADFEKEYVYKHDVLINLVDFSDQEVFSRFSLDNFDNTEYLIDLSSKNFFSRLNIDARDRGIKSYNGLYKDLFQHKKSLEILMRKKYDDGLFEDIYADYKNENLNIVLVGMPGAGKTTIGRKLAKILNRKHIDLDRQFYYEYGIAPQEYLRKYDEKSFRQKEKIVVEKIGNLRGVVISTSGGAVSEMDNYYPLKKNSIIFMVERELSYLSTKNRPLSEGGINTLIEMKKKRQDNYAYFTDYTVENRGDFNGVAYEIRDIFERICY